MANAYSILFRLSNPHPLASAYEFVKKALSVLLAGIALVSFSSSSAPVEPLKIGYSDWPGFTIFEVAKQKEWFQKAGVVVDLVWFDYLPSLDAFAAGKIDAVTVVATDALVNGANGAKSKIIALLDYSDGSDMIIGKPGIESIKDLKGQKVGIEATLVEHLLLLEALKQNDMSQSDVEIVNTATNETPQTLASGKVAAVGACTRFPAKPSSRFRDQRSFLPAPTPRALSMMCSPSTP